MWTEDDRNESVLFEFWLWIAPRQSFHSHPSYARAARSTSPTLPNRSATSGLRLTAACPSVSSVTPSGKLPWLLISSRSDRISTWTLAPVRYQSRRITALSRASRTASIGYAGMFSRRSDLISYASRVLRNSLLLGAWKRTGKVVFACEYSGGSSSSRGGASIVIPVPCLNLVPAPQGKPDEENGEYD